MGAFAAAFMRCVCERSSSCAVRISRPVVAMNGDQRELIAQGSVIVPDGRGIEQYPPRKESTA